jgi:hypothetical protein
MKTLLKIRLTSCMTLILNLTSKGFTERGIEEAPHMCAAGVVF